MTTLHWPSGWISTPDFMLLVVKFANMHIACFHKHKIVQLSWTSICLVHIHVKDIYILEVLCIDIWYIHFKSYGTQNVSLNAY